ncbi:hypothetical protein IJ750_05090 [bacterium]|nr:hypothetical protein [bacterium]
MLKVVIIGYGEMFTNLIAGTLDANCQIVGILRSEMVKYNPIQRKLKDIFNPSLDYNYIKSYNLPEIHSNGVNTKKFKNALLKLNPDIILVGSWGEKISKEIYDIPKIATINAHPSLLPKYRGPNPYYWVIKNQEDVTGITFHLIDDNIDTGAILAQEEIKIFPSDTGKSLKERTVLTARGVVCELLKDLSEDIIIPLQQREDKASYYSHPDEYELDFNKSAEENSATIRAIYPWDEAYFYCYDGEYSETSLCADPQGLEISDNNTKFTEPGTVVGINENQKQISVLCGNNRVLTMHIEHCKKYDRPFTKNYIRREIQIGKTI